MYVRVLRDARPLVEVHEISDSLFRERRIILRRPTVPSNNQIQPYFWVNYTFNPDENLARLCASERFREIWIYYSYQSLPVAVRVFIDQQEYSLTIRPP